MNKKISVIIPAKNEESGLETLLPELLEISSRMQMEILVVDDGSIDNTVKVCEKYGVAVVSHRYSMGNGAAIKTGARNANGEIFIFMDADGQHRPEDIERLLQKFFEGFDMVVGNRDSKSQASFGRLAANRIYNSIASWMVGHRIRDLTSGFRVVNAEKFKEFLYLLPNGFSYPTTSTMAFFRAGYSVCYEPINAKKREGDSHIRIVRDGIKFLLIIFKVGTLYSPLRLFALVSGCTFTLGLAYYGYTYLTSGRFTNMGMLLILCSIFVFMVGLISEQISTLFYKK